jgi:outer membrane biosynthesis protein TonB
MRRQAGWVLFVLMAVVAGVACVRLLPMRLSPSELRLGKSPQVPLQPTAATIACTRGLVVSVADVGRDWSVTQDPPCTSGDILVHPIAATAAEMAELKSRPSVTFVVDSNGQVGNASILRTSGSKTLDKRSLNQFIAQHYEPHNCGICKISTVVDVDFQGPVWMRESAQ